MDKQQIKEVMEIARPAIIALYGRYGSLRMVSYMDLDVTLWVQVDWILGSTTESYKLRLEKGRVTHLSEGQLNI